MVGTGWQLIDHHPSIVAWANAAHKLALETLALRNEPWRCGGTWLVGVDALPNDATGAIPGAAFPWDALPLTPEPLHKAQLSVIKPGYPQPTPAETEAAFQYRLNRDAAHLDGLILQPDGARMMQEPHHWILGLPLNESAASPLVVWDGSHDIMRAALIRALAQVPPENWGAVDLNPTYQAAPPRYLCHLHPPPFACAPRPGDPAAPPDPARRGTLAKRRKSAARRPPHRLSAPTNAKRAGLAGSPLNPRQQRKIFDENFSAPKIFRSKNLLTTTLSD